MINKFINMKNRNNIGVVLISVGIFSTPAISLANTNSSWARGFFTGALISACSFYKFDQISQNMMRVFVKRNFKMIEEEKFLNQKDKQFLYAIYDDDDTKECKRFIP